MSSDLVRLTEAAQMLAEAKTLPQIRTVHNMAQRAQDYAKAARLGLDAQNSAAAIALEAEARAGELLIRLKETGERRTKGESLPHLAPSDMKPATLKDLDVTPDESSRWQAVAAVPAETRAAYVLRAQENEQEITRAGLLRSAKASDALPMTDVHRRKFPDLAAADLTADLSGAISKVRTDVLDPAKWTERVEQMRPEDIARLRSKVGHIGRWVDAWNALLDERKPLRVIGGTES